MGTTELVACIAELISQEQAGGESLAPAVKGVRRVAPDEVVVLSWTYRIVLATMQVC